MKRLSHVKSRDHNELKIVRALESAGATVIRLDDPADLLVGFRGKNHLLEVKSEKGRLTEKQQVVHAWYLGTIHVVRTPQEAVQAIGGGVAR